MCVAPSYLLAGGKTLLCAIDNLFHGKLFDEKFLMSISSVGALALGEYFEAVAVMLFAGIGELFESFAVNHARGAVKELAKLCPDTVNLKRDGKICTVASEEAQVGDIFVVNPGERVPLDGEILEGSTCVDSSALTGESVPVEHFPGDEIPAGVINVDGTVTVRAKRVASESFAARILSSVEDAASKKSKAESVITKFSLWYTPAVCTIAAIIAFVFPFVFGGFAANFPKFAYIALEFLVVSCPCALIISVPLTFFGAIGGAASQGILFKSHSAPEALSKASVCVFDKTGTLTDGKFSVLGAYVDLDLCCEADFWQVAAAVEAGSTHPIALGILSHAKSILGEISSEISCDAREMRGYGRILETQDDVTLAGNLRLMEKYGVDCSQIHSFDRGTSVYVAQNGKLLGIICLADLPKKTSKQAISALKSRRVKVSMLSGDSESAVKSVAKELGIDSYRYKLLPDEKLSAIEEMIKSEGGRGTLAFVGDGINDAPALARADVGIAMGALGSDAAIEAADVVISDDDPERIAAALDISKRTVLIARQNIAFAISVKLLVMLLCYLGVFNMWGAVFADVGVSVIAILNAMRTLLRKN